MDQTNKTFNLKNIISVSEKENSDTLIHRFSIISYNIKNPLKKENDNSFLNRLNRIVQEIKDFHSDIICLQEMNEEILNIFKKEFIYYSFEFSKNDGSSMMNVIAYKSDIFSLEYSPRTIELSEVNVYGYNRGVNIFEYNRGVINIILKHIQTNTQISVFNVHLISYPVFVFQNCQILRIILEYIKWYNISNVFLVGDFNSKPNSLLFKLLKNETYILQEEKQNLLKDPERLKEFKQKVFKKNSSDSNFDQNEKIKTEFESFINQSCNYLNLEMNEENKKMINFNSSYQNYKSVIDIENINIINFGGYPDFTFCSKNFIGTIDYIWYSSTFELLKIQKLPECVEFVNVNSIPNENYPSDHLLLFSEFTFK